jgi:hypothetical protein
MVIAATTLTPAAFGIADDLRLIRPSPRAAAAIMAHRASPGPADNWPRHSKILA